MIAEITFIANGNVARVPSETKEGLVYQVDLKDGSCNCADHIHRQRKCKHIKAAEAARTPQETPRQDKGASILNECKTLSEGELTVLIGRLIDEADRRREEARLLQSRDEWETLERLFDDTAVIDDSSHFAEQDERLARLVG